VAGPSWKIAKMLVTTQRGPSGNSIAEMGVEITGCRSQWGGQNVAWFYFRDDPTVGPSAAVLLKEASQG
jgi:hypothetical protein